MRSDCARQTHDYEGRAHSIAPPPRRCGDGSQRARAGNHCARTAHPHRALSAHESSGLAVPHDPPLAVRCISHPASLPCAPPHRTPARWTPRPGPGLRRRTSRGPCALAPSLAAARHAKTPAVRPSRLSDPSARPSVRSDDRETEPPTTTATLLFFNSSVIDTSRAGVAVPTLKAACSSRPHAHLDRAFRSSSRPPRPARRPRDRAAPSLTTPRPAHERAVSRERARRVSTTTVRRESAHVSARSMRMLCVCIVVWERKKRRCDTYITADLALSRLLVTARTLQGSLHPAIRIPGFGNSDYGM